MNYWCAPAEHRKRRRNKKTVQKEKKTQVKTLSMTCAAHAHIVRQTQRCRSAEELYAVLYTHLLRQSETKRAIWWRMPHCMGSLSFVRWTWPRPYVSVCSEMSRRGQGTSARMNNDNNNNWIYVTRLTGFSSGHRTGPYRSVWRYQFFAHFASQPFQLNAYIIYFFCCCWLDWTTIWHDTIDAMCRPLSC